MTTETEKQETLLFQYKSGVLSFCRKYRSEQNFLSQLLHYISFYDLERKLSLFRQAEARAYLSGILDILRELEGD